MRVCSREAEGDAEKSSVRENSGETQWSVVLQSQETQASVRQLERIIYPCIIFLDEVTLQAVNYVSEKYQYICLSGTACRGKRDV